MISEEWKVKAIEALENNTWKKFTNRLAADLEEKYSDE